LNLGRLTKMNLLDIWKNEDEFNNWLADHLTLLSKVIGIELELVSREEKIGEFSADIVAKDVNTNDIVIIESQLNKSDHDHLGKIITYASGKDASIVIWISPEIREEHRSALEWLNNNTTENISFFGLEIEILRIDDSPPAPRFNIVSKPNTWRRRVAQKLSKKDLMYQEYFQELVDRLRSQGLTNARKGSPQSWFCTGAGRSGFLFCFVFARNRYRLELYIDTEDKGRNKRAFDHLKGLKNDIEKAIGGRLIWERLDDARASRIYVEYPNPITIKKVLEDAELRSKLFQWSIKKLKKFKEVFTGKIKDPKFLKL